ncbi:carboxylesterase family protein [Microbacterium sp. LRZ72]|uniref:carboxylesterase/lipase family protein n=1 Tax=Microbacterium sp. LRZ72 TaxID=2942481 RepID=UPI0029A6A41E|nr:carboxylesterase family protein [Microbacterium sp. LRZ72]MDX2376484.1 carboxylesterase family protein [Microbacterium sp. LRZ72]
MTMSERPEARTRQGDVRGVAHGPGAAFLGIPYAEPPIGALRFAAPEPPRPWSGVREATAYGPTPLRTDLGDTTLIPEPAVSGADTLSVNVFTPSPDPGARLPVWVWIHGGGYTTGSPASPWYDGSSFARDGVVTVTLSYRLGFDGFGWIEGAPQNRGVRDWVAALEWVRENIASFGGDPARVTIAGQSAGGGAVLTLLGMPSAQHLFQQVWCSSGALADIPEERSRATAARLAGELGVAPDRDGFRSVTEERILEAQVRAPRARGIRRLALARELLRDGSGYGPVVDGDLIRRPTPASLAAGVGADKPLVLGANDDEFTMITTGAAKKLRFVPARPALRLLGLGRSQTSAYLDANRDVHRRGTAALLGRYLTDRIFRAPTAAVAQARDEAPSGRGERAATWLYRFTWRSPTHGIALHCLDVPFLFDVLEAPRVDEIAGSSPPRALADAVHRAAVAFLTTGAPGWSPAPEGPAGPARIFDADPAAATVMHDAYASTAALVPVSGTASGGA